MSSKKNTIYYFDRIEYPYENKWDTNKNNVEFTLQNVHYSIANSIRRSLISMIPTIGFVGHCNSAIDNYMPTTIKVHHNNTYLNNDIIIQRFSCIPLHIPDVDSFDCEDYEFVLDEYNNTNELKTVHTGHIKIKQISTNSFLSEKDTRKIFPANPLTGDFIPIVKLKPKYMMNIEQLKEVQDEISKNYKIPVQDLIGLKVTATCIKYNAFYEGYGSFSPVAMSVYGNTLDEEKVKAGLVEYARQYRENEKTMGFNPLTDDQIKQKFIVNESARYFKTDDYDEPNSFDFKVESQGVIPPLVIVERGIQSLINMIDNFIINLDNRNDKFIEVKPLLNIGNGFEIIVKNEDDTLGNLVHCYLSRMFADFSLDPEDRMLESITYHKTHPTEKKIIFNIKTRVGFIQETIKDVIIPGCKELGKLLQTIKQQLEDTLQYQQELKRI
jgi:DNA-directed RNA polymerase subunit L